MCLCWFVAVVVVVVFFLKKLVYTQRCRRQAGEGGGRVTSDRGSRSVKLHLDG